MVVVCLSPRRRHGTLLKQYRRRRSRIVARAMYSAGGGDKVLLKTLAETLRTARIIKLFHIRWRRRLLDIRRLFSAAPPHAVGSNELHA